MSEFIDTWWPRAVSTYEVLAARPFAVAFLALFIAYAVFATRRRKQRLEETGEVQSPALAAIREPFAYAKEDTNPVLKKAPGFLPKHLIAASITVAVASVVFTYDWVGVIALVGTFAFLQKRWKPVKANRDWFVEQVFPVAQADLKLPKGAELAKNSYIVVEEWKEELPSYVRVLFPSNMDVTAASKSKFEAHWNDRAMEGMSWTFEWKPASNCVIIEAQKPLPNAAPLPFPTRGDFEWNEMPLGIGTNGKPLVWDPTVIPHVLIAGVSGSGKSMTQRSILLHALQSPFWDLILLDPKRVELSMYKDADGVLTYAVTDDEMLATLQAAQDQMEARFEMMEGHGVQKYSSLPEPPRALLVMIDELTSLLSETGDKEKDAGKKEAKAILGKLAREGRAAGLYLVLATQRPDADIMRGDTRNTVEGRIGMGRMNTIASNMILDDVVGTRTPADPRGRGIFKDLDGYHAMQGYYLPDEQLSAAISWANRIRRGQDPEELRALIRQQTQPVDTEPVKVSALGRFWGGLIQDDDDEDENPFQRKHKVSFDEELTRADKADK